MKQSISGPVAVAMIAIALAAVAGIAYFGFFREKRQSPEALKASMEQGMADRMKKRYGQPASGRPGGGQPVTPGR